MRFPYLDVCVYECVPPAVPPDSRRPPELCPVHSPTTISRHPSPLSAVLRSAQGTVELVIVLDGDSFVPFSALRGVRT